MDKIKYYFTTAVVLHFHFFAGNPQTFDCPTNWFKNGGSCYHFQNDSPKTFEEARITCSNYGAGLISIDNIQEHEFVTKWLQIYDSDLGDWYTSGVRESIKSGVIEFVWQGSGEVVNKEVQFWGEDQVFNDSTGVVVYKLTAGGYRWSISDASMRRPYICEVPEAESYRILQDFRDFDYGKQHGDMNKIERGPHFILQPHNTVVVGDAPEIILECVATGFPHPTYSWYKGENFETHLTKARESRYTFTNGKLIISKPIESIDSGLYRCQVENKYGIIISDGIRLSFGSLGEFSNVPDAPVNARAYEGAAIDCSRISYKPAVKYQWFKRGTDQFVRPQFQKYMFISQNGKLYFSEVTRADEGKYFCMAMLTGLNQYSIGTSQPPTRTSLPILLNVHDKAPIAEWGPVIQNEFIGVYPKPPMAGQDVSLECFAYGTSTSEFHYTWSRENKPLPKKSFLTDHNRVLTIREATLDDQGVYTCRVSRGTSSKDQKSVDLKLGSKPYFITPLRNQHADIGSQLTWRCEARANPLPYFHWYKNGKRLTTDPDTHIKVVNNVLVIQHLDPDLHNGMFQCAATNTYGTSFSEGQMRVLAIAPNFFKNPMQSLTRTSLLGNLTLLCRPEGAPLPKITWFKDGAELPVLSSNVEQLSSGYLIITSTNKGDEGRYTCRARNIFGEAEDSTLVTVADATSITVAPLDQSVIVNSTAFFYCHASHAKEADVIYNWLFNGRTIDFQRNPEYKKVQEDDSGRSGLYVLSAGFFNAGYYECEAMTTLNNDRKGAYLTVMGPPFEPGGVEADASTVTNTSVVIRWVPGASNGREITNYIIQFAEEYEEDTWHTAIGDFPAYVTVHDVKRKHFAEVKDLNPGCGYRFRVIAVNQFGHSPPSSPSSYVQTISAPPRVAPSDVGGGDGRVGDLTMTWTSLSRAEQGGEDIGYRLYWRRHTGREDDPWAVQDVLGNADHFVTQVGTEYYYLEYDFKIQAFNRLGFGPNSSEVIIMSAEDLPAATATDVRAQGLNGTAITVWWNMVSDEREYARGKILGYQINYWHEEEEATDYKEFIRHYGQVDTGIVIGLKSDNFYFFTLQPFNSAGLGPLSEYYHQESLHAPLADYPEEIRVFSAGRHRVEVWWRGVMVDKHEGNIYGYVIYYWPANEHYRTASHHVVNDRFAYRAVIQVDTGVVYAVRVSGFGEGGYGKKSLTTYFTLEGNKILIDYNLAKTVEAFRSAAMTSSVSALFITLMFLVIVSSLS